MTSAESKVHQLIQERFRRVLIHEYMAKAVDRAGFGGLSILRTPLGTRITIKTERPGIVIGRKGRDIQRLTDDIERLFDLENPQIEAIEVKNVHLNPQIMASKLVFALERGWNFRRAGNAMLQRVMEAGARGCQITLTGKLTGRRHRSEKFISGHIKHCGETAIRFMQTGFAVARRKEGVIGCKVAIMPPDAKLPDEVTIRDLEAEAEATAKVEAQARRKAEERAAKEAAAEAAGKAKAKLEKAQAKKKKAEDDAKASAKAREKARSKDKGPETPPKPELPSKPAPEPAPGPAAPPAAEPGPEPQAPAKAEVAVPTAIEVPAKAIKPKVVPSPAKPPAEPEAVAEEPKKAPRAKAQAKPKIKTPEEEPATKAPEPKTKGKVKTEPGSEADASKPDAGEADAGEPAASKPDNKLEAKDETSSEVGGEK